MDKERTKEIIDRLLREIEEEDIGISLFSTFYQNQVDLCFFKPDDRERVSHILKKLSDDSSRHKKELEEIIVHLGRSFDEK
jgi:hypothetical protein